MPSRVRPDEPAGRFSGRCDGRDRKPSRSMSRQGGCFHCWAHVGRRVHTVPDRRCGLRESRRDASRCGHRVFRCRFAAPREPLPAITVSLGGGWMLSRTSRARSARFTTLPAHSKVRTWDPIRSADSARLAASRFRLRAGHVHARVHNTGNTCVIRAPEICRYDSKRQSGSGTHLEEALAEPGGIVPVPEHRGPPTGKSP